jgi:terminase small subunit / prophage DNA-packing protein
MDVDQVPTQQQVADVLGVSQPKVSDLTKRRVLQPGMTLRECVQAYCANLREVAAGRVAVGDINLVTERARLASEQADRVAMLNAERRRELVSLPWVSTIIARRCQQIAQIFDSVVPALRRFDTNLTAGDLELVDREITKARNLAADFDLQVIDLDEPGGDPDGATGGVPLAGEADADAPESVG